MMVIAQRTEKDLQKEKKSAQPVESSWAAEIEKRIKEIDAGGVEKIDAFQALKEM